MGPNENYKFMSRTHGGALHDYHLTVTAVFWAGGSINNQIDFSTVFLRSLWIAHFP